MCALARAPDALRRPAKDRPHHLFCQSLVVPPTELVCRIINAISKSPCQTRQQPFRRRPRSWTATAGPAAKKDPSSAHCCKHMSKLTASARTDVTELGASPLP